MPARRTPIARALATHLDPRGAASRAFQQICSAAHDARTILVSSERRFDGTSVCASNVALALARAGRSVVLVDANLAHPAQHVFFGLEASSGLREAIYSIASLPWLIRSTDIERLSVLVSGTSPSRDLVVGDGLTDVIDKLESQFDQVVIDGPTLAGDVARQLVRRCDLTLRIAHRRTVTVHAAA